MPSLHYFSASISSPQTCGQPGNLQKIFSLGVVGVDAVASAFDPQWVHLTANSYQQLNQLGQFNMLPGGLLAGVLRGANGRFEHMLTFNTMSLNPAMKANAAVMVAVMVLRSAMSELEAVVEAMDVKLDQLFADNRIAALGDVQGLTHVLARFQPL